MIIDHVKTKSQLIYSAWKSDTQNTYDQIACDMLIKFQLWLWYEDAITTVCISQMIFINLKRTPNE